MATDVYPLPPIQAEAEIIRNKDAASDAFGRLRVSEPQSLSEVAFHYDVQPMMCDIEGTGTVAHGGSRPTAVLTVTSGQTAEIHTRNYPRYQPGKSHKARLTFASIPAAPSLFEVGFFDANDGLFLRCNRSGGTFVRRTSISGSPVDNLAAQGSWNIDNFDGFGPSGIVLNWNAAQQVIIDTQWLGIGRARCGFEIDGEVRYAHEFAMPNNLNEPVMRTATRPLRWRLNGNGAAATAEAVCGVIISEGGHDPTAYPFARGLTTGKSVTGARVPLLSIRPMTTFAGRVNHAQTFPSGIDILSNQNVLIEVLVDATLTGASFASADSNSHIEWDSSATAVTGGRPAWTAYVAGAQGTTSTTLGVELNARDWAIGYNDILGLQRTLTVVATQLGTNATVFGAIRWREVRT